ncbi:nad dependent epimerase [Seiridium cupressi]
MRLLRSFSTRRTTSRTSWSPAIHGSVAILEALQKWGTSIKRIVATSSHASCVDISKGKRPGYVYDEKDWNPVTYEEASKADGVSAYCASKALAERAMWGWVETNKPNFDLVTFTPPWVFGLYASDSFFDCHWRMIGICRSCFPRRKKKSADRKRPLLELATISRKQLRKLLTGGTRRLTGHQI